MLPAHRLDVVPFIKHLEIELPGRAGSPEAQVVDRFIVITGDRNVVGHGHDVVVGIHPFGDGLALFVDALPGGPVKLDRINIIRAGNFPGIALAQPVVRRFHLEAVDDFLLEDSIFVADAVTVGR